MEQTLLSRTELANRWGISVRTLDRRIEEGVISPIKSSKTPKFNLYEILRVEGTDNSKLSLFERRRLEMTIEKLEKEKKQLLEDKEKLKVLLTNQATELMVALREV